MDTLQQNDDEPHNTQHTTEYTTEFDPTPIK